MRPRGSRFSSQSREAPTWSDVQVNVDVDVDANVNVNVDVNVNGCSIPSEPV